MSNKILASCLLITAVLMGVTPASAVFDDLVVSPRTRAMGGSSVAVGGDAWSFYNNPAGLAILAQPTAATATTEPNGGGYNRLTTLGGSMWLPGRMGGLAAGVRVYDVDFEDTQLLGEKTFSFSHGFTLFEDASTAAAIGWTLNFYNLEFGPTVGMAGDGSDGIDPGDAWSVGLDVGAVVRVHERTRVGFFTRGINNPTIGEEDEELRQQVSLGMAYEPYDGVITAFDVRSRVGEEFRFHAGFEFAVTEILDLRAGLETDPSKLTGGFGVNLPMFSLDYGFSTGGGVLESTHQFGLSYRFGVEEETP